MKTSPSFQFYPADFIGGTMLMEAHEVGAYIRLLCYQWQQGSVPNNSAKIERITGIKASKLVDVIAKFVTSEDGLTLANQRMESLREELNDYRKTQSENGKKGGRPKKPNDSQINPPLSNGLSEKKSDGFQLEKLSVSVSSQSQSLLLPSEVIPVIPLAKSKAKGTREELEAFAVEIGQPASDGSAMFDHWTANGWKNGSNPSKDWQAGMRNWKAQKWLPSQKQASGTRPPRHPAYDAESHTRGKTPEEIGKF
jgi:uncharacterized protein YdaU (DUF1376 family)